MKQKLFFTVLLVFSIIFTVVWIQNRPNKDIYILRKQHEKHLEQSPYAKTVNLSKKERKALGLPPNGYYEMQWQKTMDPRTGRPMYNRANDIQIELSNSRENLPNKGVGGETNNPWVERGPTHVVQTTDFGNLGPIGGRTRGIMFDPNDSNNERLFAGGVSGGLWVNENITDENSTWSIVDGLPSNIAVMDIIYDPNDPNIMYIGSGESYTSGAVIGNGVWKSTDAGITWTNVLGGYTGTSIQGSGGFDQIIDGIFYVNDIIARDMGTTTELYAAVAHNVFREGFSDIQAQWHGYFQHGVYKSSDNGASWVNISISGGIIDNPNQASNPNDLELDVNNNIWVATTTNQQLGFASGGKIFRSNDGVNFDLLYTENFTERMELELSPTDAGEAWTLSQTNGLPIIRYTTNAFSTVAAINIPVDADFATIPANDFTRAQSFYDLEIEVDGNRNLYVGGIDLFRSTNNGASWNQISEWYDIPSFTGSLVHADQHAIVFRPDNDNQAVFGNDGGVYYSSDLTNSIANVNGISQRNLGYSTLQFYYGAIDQLGANDGDDFIGGTQDNGSPYILNAEEGKNIFNDTFGGDGAYAEIDAADGYLIQSYQNNQHNYVPYPSLDRSQSYEVASGAGGSFINQVGLDKNLDILYVNASRNSNGNAFYIIERSSNITQGLSNILRYNLSDNAVVFDQSPTVLKVSPFTTASTTLFVGLLNGKLLRLDNADSTLDASFVDITGDSFLGTISDIEFGRDENEIFVTMSNYGVLSIWYTENGGASWKGIEGDLPDIPVNCILQNPLLPEELIVGTALGVWATPDFTVANPVWIQAYNGMSDVPITDLDLRTSDNLVLASTFGRGMYTGQFTDSALGIIESEELKSDVTIVPTVNNGNFTLLSNNIHGKVDISIYNLSGQNVYSESISNFINKKNFILNIQSGVHILVIKTPEKAITKKIVIN